MNVIWMIIVVLLAVSARTEGGNIPTQPGHERHAVRHQDAEDLHRHTHDVILAGRDAAIVIVRTAQIRPQAKFGGGQSTHSPIYIL